MDLEHCALGWLRLMVPASLREEVQEILSAGFLRGRTHHTGSDRARVSIDRAIIHYSHVGGVEGMRGTALANRPFFAVRQWS